MASTKKRMLRFGRFTAIAAVAALAITGCSTGGNGDGSDNGNGGGNGDGGSGEPVGGGTIVFQMGSDPNVVLPSISTGFADGQLGCVIFQGLTRLDTQGIPQPYLAESWEISDDGLEYTFNLVEANWHDGEPLTSADVKFSYENIASQYGPLWGTLGPLIETVETPDERTAVIKLTDPFAPLLSLVYCGHNGGIVPQHIYEGIDPTGPEMRDVTPIGTGPFTWGEAVPGQSYTLEANTDYWEEGKPLADRLVAQLINDTASAVSAIRAGEIDQINVLPANAAVQLLDVEGVEVLPSEVGSASNQFLFFNTQREPYSNPEVRQALFQAIDREYIVEHVYFGRAKPGVSPFTEDIWAYTGEVDYNELFPYDPEAAAAALDELGYPEVDGTRFTLDFLVRNDPPERIELANVMAAMWDQIGVDVTVRVLERAAENPQAFQEFNFDANIQGLSNYSDPAAGTARVFICESIGRNFGNASQFCDPEVDELFAAAAAATDIDERAELYGQLDVALAEVTPLFPILQPYSEHAIVSNLKGMIYQVGSPDWAGAYLE